MVKPDKLTKDQLLYNAVNYLLHNGKEEAAKLLIECELESWGSEQDCPYLVVTISAPYAIHAAIKANPDIETGEWGEAHTNFRREEIAKAFEAILRSEEEVAVVPYVQLIAPNEEGWRDHLRKLATGEKTTNQGITSPQRQPAVIWQGLNFWSVVERMVAEALDRRGVMYLANCMARVGPPDHRHNQEPDFLICHNGKWGILEVDGATYHTKTVAKDQEFDRQYRRHGVKYIERFDAMKCKQNPDAVVAEFLDLLEKNG